MKLNLSDICEYAKGKIAVADLNEDCYISTENMLPNKSGITSATSLPKTSQTQSFQAGDILVSNIRPYFKKIWFAEFDGGCSNDVLVFRAKKGISSSYLYYVLANDEFFDYAMKTSNGTKMPRGDKKAIMKYEVEQMDFDTQKKSAVTLRSIDQKIALNTAINENLEQQAQAIFKSWFVDFEPFGGVMPDDWKTSHLLSVANYLNGLAMQKYRPIDGEIGLPVLKIKELRQGFCDSNSELCSPSIKSEYIIQNGDVIFSWSGSLLVDFWCGGQCGLNQHLFKVTSNTYDKWFYFVWTKYHLNRFIAIAADMATTMGHIKRSELEKSQVFIPNKADYKIIGSLLKPIYDTIINNRIENQRLAELRDSLLPKLMNGEIDVSRVQL